MHIQMSSYLLLSIAVILYSIHDLLISFSLVQYHIFLEYLIERRPVHISMTLGYFRNVLMFPDMGDEPFHGLATCQRPLCSSVLESAGSRYKPLNDK